MSLEALDRRQLLAALLGIAVLAALPMGIAVAVGRSRVARTMSEAASVSRWVSAIAGRRQLGALDVLAGPGETPKASRDSRWIDARTDWLSSHLPPAEARELQPDPWNNRYLVNIGAAVPSSTDHEQGFAVWVLSAGPNGVIETPFAQPADRAALGGDDVGVRVKIGLAR